MSSRKKAFEKAQTAALSVRIFTEGTRCHLAAISKMQDWIKQKVAALRRIYAGLGWRDQQYFKSLIRRAASPLRGAEKDVLLSIVETTKRPGRPTVSRQKARRGRPRTKPV